jgi:uncharacterized protein YciI
MRFPLALALLVLPAAAPAQTTPDARATWFIFLETGAKTSDDKELVARMQRGHIANFQKLFGEKKLFAAGPLADPSKKKRGIVVVKANTRDEVNAYFQADDYVREGYMTLNAERAVVHKALNTEGIDPQGIQEERIVQILRPRKAMSAADQKHHEAFLRGLVDKGTVGAWYTLEGGAISDVLFCRSTDTPGLQTLFAEAPAVKAHEAPLLIWPQYLSKGVVR